MGKQISKRKKKDEKKEKGGCEKKLPRERKQRGEALSLSLPKSEIRDIYLKKER